MKSNNFTDLGAAPMTPTNMYNDPNLIPKNNNNNNRVDPYNRPSSVASSINYDYSFNMGYPPSSPTYGIGHGGHINPKQFFERDLSNLSIHSLQSIQQNIMAAQNQRQRTFSSQGSDASGSNQILNFSRNNSDLMYKNNGIPAGVGVVGNKIPGFPSGVDYNMIPSRPGSRMSQAPSLSGSINAINGLPVHSAYSGSTVNNKIPNYANISTTTQNQNSAIGFNDITHLEKLNYPIAPNDLILENAKNFIGRTEFITQITKAFDNNNLVCLVGDACTGKTALMYHLMADKNELQTKIAATQFCQVDYDQTCRLPDIIFSLAKQVYFYIKTFEAENASLLENRNTVGLSKIVTCKNFKNCLQDAMKIFKMYIINPIIELVNTVNDSSILPYLILQIDDISASNYHRSSSARSLSLLDLLSSAAGFLPDCCKILLSVRTEHRSLLQVFNKSSNIIQIELYPTNDEYIFCYKRLGQIAKTRRIFPAAGMPGNHTGADNLTKSIEELSKYLSKVSKGDFLYLTLIFDLIEQGSIRLKSNNYQAILPSNRWQAITQLFKCKTMITTMFCPLMHDILAVILASLRPLSEDQLYRSLACLDLLPDGIENIKSCPKIIPTISSLTVSEFKRKLARLAGILTVRPDHSGQIDENEEGNIKNNNNNWFQNESIRFSHIMFKEWLEKQIAVTSIRSQFTIDIKCGHFVLSCAKAFCSDQRDPFQLGHHMLKAGLIRVRKIKDLKLQFENPTSNSNNFSPQDNLVKILWSHFIQADLTQALKNQRNIFYPNIHVSQVLLTYGANANVPTEILYNSPLINLYSYLGNLDMIKLLVSFNCNVDELSTNDMNCLSLAASNGHLDICKILVLKGGANLILQKDQNGQICILHAALKNRSEVVLFIYKALVNLLSSPNLQNNRHLQEIVSSGISIDEYLQNNNHYYTLDRQPDKGCLNNNSSTSNLIFDITKQLIVALCSTGNLPLLKTIINIFTYAQNFKEKFSFNFKDSLLNEAPLLMAIKKNQCHLVEYIQSVNEQEFAEIAFNNFLSSSGYNALGLAAKLGHLPILEILVKFNLKSNKTREMPLGNLIKGLTVLDIASQYSHDRTLEIIKVLLNKYRIGNKGGELLGRNSACYAVEHLHVQNLAVLMKHGVDVSGTGLGCFRKNREFL